MWCNFNVDSILETYIFFWKLKAGGESSFDFIVKHTLEICTRRNVVRPFKKRTGRMSLISSSPTRIILDWKGFILDWNIFSECSSIPHRNPWKDHWDRFADSSISRLYGLGDVTLSSALDIDNFVPINVVVRIFKMLTHRNLFLLLPLVFG